MTAAPARTPVIDVCDGAYDVDSWRVVLDDFAARAPGYLHTFGPIFAQHAGVARADYAAALARDAGEAVDLLMAGGGLGTTAAEQVARLDEQGVRHQVLHGVQLPLPGGGTVNDRVAAIAAAHPDRITAWAGIDPRDGDAALAELDRCVGELGMRGLMIAPFNAGVDPDDPRCHRLYERAVEHGVPLWIHTGMNLAANRPLRSCTWDHVDRIAVAHPDLVVLAGHGGWPWIVEAMAVLQRHANVYLEFSAHRPRVMGRPGSGWEPLMFYGRTVVRHKILFGTGGFVQSQTIRELADEVEQLELGEDVARAWLHDNAARLLGV